MATTYNLNKHNNTETLSRWTKLIPCLDHYQSSSSSVNPISSSSSKLTSFPSSSVGF